MNKQEIEKLISLDIKKILDTTTESSAKIKYETKIIPISTNDGIWMIRIKDIIRIESHDNYIKIFMTNSESLFIAKTLKIYEQLLLNYPFERIHKSHLINLHHIKRYYKNDGGYVLMNDDTQIEVARLKREKLMIRLELL